MQLVLDEACKMRWIRNPACGKLALDGGRCDAINLIWRSMWPNWVGILGWPVWVATFLHCMLLRVDVAYRSEFALHFGQSLHCILARCYIAPWPVLTLHLVPFLHCIWARVCIALFVFVPVDSPLHVCRLLHCILVRFYAASVSVVTLHHLHRLHCI